MRTHGPAAIERPDRFAPLVTSAARAVVRRRLAELEPRDRAVAAARAMIGDGAPPHAIAQVATIELTELGRAHDALTAAGFLRADGNDIAHELIASAIRDELTSAERERLHRESARALIELGASSEVVARHLLECRPQGDADISDWLERAGADAARRGAPGAASISLERALEERTPVADRARLSANLATAAFDAGRPDPRARLRDALGETRDRAGRVDLLTRLATYDVIFGGDAGDVRLLTRELSDPRTGPDAQLRLQAALLDALLAFPERHAERAWRAAAIDPGAGSDPVLRRVVLAHRAWLATELGTADAQQCAAMALEAIDGGFLLREARNRAAYHLCVAVLVMTDHARQARRAIAALRDEALARGSTPMRAAAATYAAQLSLRTGRAREAEAGARDALELTSPSVWSASATRVLVAALGERGAFDEARELLRASGGGDLHTRARLALAEAISSERMRMPAMPGRATTSGPARTRPAPAGARPPRSRSPTSAAARRRRRWPRSSCHWRNGSARRWRSRGPWWRAPYPSPATRHASRSAGGRWRRWRRAAPAPSSSPSVSGSNSEARWRGLAGASRGASFSARRWPMRMRSGPRGSPNRAIAQQLFLSIKTVETHLAAGYRKLGVNTRMN